MKKMYLMHCVVDNKSIFSLLDKLDKMSVIIL